MALQNIVHQQITRLVAVQRNVAAVIGKKLDRETVGIGIGRHQKLCTDLFAKLFTESECLGVFRVRISDRGKVGIRILLFFHDVEVPEASLLHHLREGDGACAVQRGVDDRDRQIQLVTLMDRELLYHIQIETVFLLAEKRDLPFDNQCIVLGIVNVAVCEIVQGVDLLCHAVRHIRADLAAVLPVDLVSVVFLRIVGSGNVDAGHGLEDTDQAGKLRGRTKRRERVDADPGSGKDTGSQT